MEVDEPGSRESNENANSRSRRQLVIGGFGCAAILTLCVATLIVGSLADSDVDDELAVAAEPTATQMPDPTPTAAPSPDPTNEPTATATAEPEPTPTPEPTSTSIPEPTETPVAEPIATPRPRGPPAPVGEMAIYHFDVGQADATLIKAPDATILIDAGDWRRNDVVPHLRSAGVNSIDLFILTHPHADHIGQVPQVMQAFDVGEVWMSGWEHSSQTFNRALDAVLNSSAGYYEPRAGESIRIGSVVVEVVNPANPLSDVHDNLAVRIVYGGFSALYTGDAETQHEQQMVGRVGIRSTVLQLGHHGSSTSTSNSFLSKVSPEVAIYSAAANSQYGHPHDEVVNRVLNSGIDLYGTAVHGTIVVITDGDSYQVEIDRQGSVRAPPAAQPAPTPTPPPAASAPAPAAPASPGCVDINSASFDELQQIIHIGPDRAQQIIDLRPFTSVDSITRINGIAEARLRDIKNQGLACVP